MADGQAPSSSDATLRRAAAVFARPVAWRSIVQLLTSFGPFLAGCAAMYLVFPVSPSSLALGLPTGALLVRIFIVQHDCGHGSFFASPLANTAHRPPVQPDHLHALRQLGPPARRPSRQLEQSRPAEAGSDIYSACLTVREYLALTPAAPVPLSAAAPSADRQRPAAASRLPAALPPALRHAARLGARAPVGLSDQSRPRSPCSDPWWRCSAGARC